MMKRISILAIVVFTILISIGLVSGIKNFIDGWNSVDDNHDHFRNLVSLQIAKVDTTLAVDSLHNSKLGEQVPYRIETIKTFIEEPLSKHVLDIFMLPLGLFAFYGFYCLIRLLLSVARKEVFVRKNVQRMRIFVYGVILVSLVMELRNYSDYLSAVSQIQLPGYEICNYSMNAPWLFLILLALFTEILAVGVKIKEEQELTI